MQQMDRDQRRESGGDWMKEGEKINQRIYMHSP